MYSWKFKLEQSKISVKVVQTTNSINGPIIHVFLNGSRWPCFISGKCISWYLTRTRRRMIGRRAVDMSHVTVESRPPNADSESRTTQSLLTTISEDTLHVSPKTLIVSRYFSLNPWYGDLRREWKEVKSWHEWTKRSAFQTCSSLL